MVVDWRAPSSRVGSGQGRLRISEIFTKIGEKWKSFGNAYSARSIINVGRRTANALLYWHVCTLPASGWEARA